MPEKGPELFTIKIVPHSARPVVERTLSSRAFQVACVVLILMFITLTVFAARYAQMVASRNELRDLRLLTQLQDEQLRALETSSAQLQERMHELAGLDSELRQMLNLETPAEPPPVQEIVIASRSVTVARSVADRSATTPAPTTMTVEASLLQAAGYLADGMQVLEEEMEGRLASLEELRVAAAEKLAYEAARPSIWPTQGRITSRYGYRALFGGDRRLHPAVDIAAAIGTPVVATGDGRVVFTGWRSDLGNTVIIEHAYGFETRYGHVAKVAVSVGDWVNKGQVIAYVGNTGRSTGPHLHYEVHLRGKPVNPGPYLS